MRIFNQFPSQAEAQALQRFEQIPGPAPADHARDDHDAQRLGRLRERTDHLRHEQSYGPDNRQPIRPNQLAGDIRFQLDHRRRYDASVSLDQIGQSNFTYRRAEQLAQVPGGTVFAAQYGQSFAADMADFEPFYPRLNIANDLHVDYHREEPSPALQENLEKLYADQGYKLPKDHDVVFVNSLHTVTHLKRLLSSPLVQASSSVPAAAGVSPPPVALARGIFGVPVLKDERLWADRIIVLLGARPSSYQAKRVFCGPLAQIPAAANVDNEKCVALLRRSRPDAPSHRLRLAVPSEGAGAMAHAAAALIEDLGTALDLNGKLKEHRQNPMLRLGLTGVMDHAEKLNSLHNDTARFSNAYRALMEELHVVLATARPYNEGDFKRAALSQLARGLDPAVMSVLKTPEVYLATSGMNALMQGLETAKDFSGDDRVALLFSERHGTSPIYYEVGQLMALNQQKKSSESRTLLAVLNHSTPEANGRNQTSWDVDAVIETTRARISKHLHGERPYTLVLDTTVEHRSDLRRLTTALKEDLAQGKLQIVLCKSYQKYANLCSAKVMAGSIAVLGRDSAKRQHVEERLRETEKSYGWFSNDESQLMTHFLRSGQYEFALLERAVANANFVRDSCFTGQGDHAAFDGHHRHLPFAMLLMNPSDNDYEFPVLQIRTAQDNHTLMQLPLNGGIDNHRVRERDSFGFSETIQVSIEDLAGYGGSTMRLSFGQESKAELIEMFYASSRLLKGGNVLSPQQVSAHVNELVQAGLTVEQRRETMGKSLAYKLSLIGANEAPILDDRMRLEASVPVMRRALERSQPQQAFTLNKIASLIGQLGSITFRAGRIDMLAGGADRELVEQLLEGMISSKMLGVSPIGREAVARFYGALCSFDMRAPDTEENGDKKEENPGKIQRRKGVENLLYNMERMNLANQRGAFIGLVPDQVMSELPMSLRERLLDMIFQPLSPLARIALIDRHLDNDELNFAQACIELMERQDTSQISGLAGAVQMRAALLQAQLQGEA